MPELFTKDKFSTVALRHLRGVLLILFLAAIFVTVIQITHPIPADAQQDWRAQWITSLHKAKIVAGKEKKPLLLVFTDRDDCEQCVMLEGDVFATVTFAQWSHDNAVLMRIDMSTRRDPSPKTIEENNKLKEQYKVENLPTVIFVDEKGDAHGRLEYIEGDSIAWIEAAEKIIEQMPEPPVVKPESSYRRARTKAAVDNQPLLVIVRESGSPRIDLKLEQLYTDEKMVELANAGLAVVDLIWPDKIPIDPENPDDQADDSKLFDGFVEQYKVKRRPIQLFVIDSVSGDVAYQSFAPPNADSLARQITKSMPGLTYRGEWLTDFDLANKISLQTKKPILLFFGNSDGSIWTTRLFDEVFNTRQFKEYAEDRLILVYLDFPRNTSLPPDLDNQNKQLQKRFSVRGMPTLVLMNSRGGEIDRMGYIAGGPDNFIKILDKNIQ